MTTGKDRYCSFTDGLSADLTCAVERVRVAICHPSHDSEAWMTSSEGGSSARRGQSVVAGTLHHHIRHTYTLMRGGVNVIHVFRKQWVFVARSICDLSTFNYLRVSTSTLLRAVNSWNSYPVSPVFFACVCRCRSMSLVSLGRWNFMMFPLKSFQRLFSLRR